MIITVICPICGKKIQIEDANDANICVCCGKPFVTSKALLVKNEETIFDEKTTNTTNQADHYFNNIVGLLEKGVGCDDEVVITNYNRFKTDYPLDTRIAVCDYLFQYDKYQRLNKDFNLIYNLLNKLKAIKETEYYEIYYNQLLKNVNELTKTDTNEMLNIKLYLGNFSVDTLTRNVTNYKSSLEKYISDLKKCESTIRTYEKHLEKHGSAVRSFLNRHEISIPHDFYLSSLKISELKIDKNMSLSEYENEIDRYAKELNSASLKLTHYEKRINSYRSYSYSDFPYQAVCVVPIIPIKPYLDQSLLLYLKDVYLALKIDEYGIDKDYLYSEYKKFNNSGLKEYSEVNNIISKLFNLLPDELKNEIKEEERIKKEKLRKEKEEAILKEIEKFWIKYVSIVKNQGVKAGYNYLNQIIRIENKIVYVNQELNNYKKGLFGVKYLSDINTFSIEDNKLLTYKKMNFNL